MKKILSILIAVICILSSFSIIGCGGNDGRCAQCSSFEETISYKQVKGKKQVNKGYACKICGIITSPIETINADYVVNSVNELSVAQAQAETKGVDSVILVTAGEYNVAKIIERTRGKTRIIFETGVDIFAIDVASGAYNTILENAHFYSKPGPKSVLGGVRFLDGNVRDEIGQTIYCDITVRNCSFKGHTNIARTWLPGMLENLTVEGCDFKDVTNDYYDDDGNYVQGSLFASVFLSETDGTTTIRNNTFNDTEFGCVYIGYRYDPNKTDRAASGTIIIENNYFGEFHYKGPSAIPGAVTVVANNYCEVYIENNIFNNVKGIEFNYYQRVTKETTYFEVLQNKWNVIPETIENADYYDMDEQELI